MTLFTLPVDQWTKYLAKTNYLIHEDASDSTIYQGRRVEVIGIEGSQGWFLAQLTYVRNHGASWGFLSKSDESLRITVLVLTGVFFSVGLLWVSYRLMRSDATRPALFLVGMVAGSLGNLSDRIRCGYVTDFISLRGSLGTLRFNLPSFNVADLIIIMSLICLIVTSVAKKIERPMTNN